LEEKVPRFGNFGRKSSKVWKFPDKKFQGLEVLEEKVPRLGNFRAKSSKHWKKKFQALEVLQGKVPSFESSISTAFRVCPALSVTCSRRRLYPALPAQSAQRGIPAAASQSRLVNGPIVNRRSLRSHRRVQPRSDTAGAAYSRIKEKNLP